MEGREGFHLNTRTLPVHSRAIMKHTYSLIFFAAAGIALTACTVLPTHTIVAASESAVSYRSNTSSPPEDKAKAHCAQYGRKAKFQGGVPLGEPAVWTIYGYDCIK